MKKLIEELMEEAGSYDDEMSDIVGMHLKDIPNSVSFSSRPATLSPASVTRGFILPDSRARFRR